VATALVRLGRLGHFGGAGELLLVVVLVPLALVRSQAPVAVLVADLPRLGVAASDLLQDAVAPMPQHPGRGRSEPSAGSVAASYKQGNELHMRCRADAVHGGARRVW
jgi:hypothetical protein